MNTPMIDPRKLWGTFVRNADGSPSLDRDGQPHLHGAGLTLEEYTACIKDFLAIAGMA